MSAAPIADPSAIQRYWRCFHCDEVFETKESAREHFGPDEGCSPACQIDIAEYRRLEDQQAACRAECCEEAKRYHAAEDDRRRALVAEEQKGYDKGVADARKEAAPQLEALKAAVRIADEAREEWDKAPSAMKAGKLLIALSGHLPGYRKDVDEIHAALEGK